MSLSVAIVSREYPPFFGGGIGTYTEEFSRALAAAGNRVVVITVSDDGQERREARGGVTVVRLPFLNGGDWTGPHANIATPQAKAAFCSFSPVSVLAMQTARALPGLVDEFQLDVVEAPDTGALAWFALNERRIGSPCGRRGWPAFITHLHSPTAWIERWDRSPQAGRAHAELKGMERDVVRWADGVLCPSHGLAVWAEGHFGLERGHVRVIRYPLGSLERPEPRAASREKAARRIVYAGRLEPRKGVDILLAGFARAVERGTDLRLDLAGKDIVDCRTGRPFGAMCLERLVPQNVRGRITIHGALPPAVLAALRRGGDLAASPAPNDNFPYSCMEAMAAGMPVVAARSGGMAEMISGNGEALLFEPGSVESCAEALARVSRMTGPELVAMGRAGRDRIGALCGTAAIVQERVAHFRQVSARRGAHEATPRDEDVIVIGRGETGPLTGAVRAGAAFAHGWVRENGTVRVFGTPTFDELAAGPRDIGPLVVARSALTSAPGVDWRSPWAVAMALARGGEQGAVVPECLNDASPEQLKSVWPHAVGTAAVDLCLSLGPAMVAAIGTARTKASQPSPADDRMEWQARAEDAEAELARIKASRGWRWLSRIYAVLHVLKGRGLSGRGGA